MYSTWQMDVNELVVFMENIPTFIIGSKSKYQISSVSLSA
jgi:hypothetical protein